MRCASPNIVPLPSLVKKKDRSIRELEQLNKELEEVNKEQAQTILDLESRLEASESHNTDLQSQNTVLKAKITELEARLGLHSGNSSFPPSRDISPPPKPGSLRKKSGNKAGGQKNV